MKNIWRLLYSKTFWVNALTILVAGADELLALDLFEPEHVTAFLTIANIVLRLLTKTPIAEKKSLKD